MGLFNPEPSQTWTDILKWLGGGSLVSAVTVLITQLFYRKKTASEVDKTTADAESARADTAVKLSNQIVVLHDKLNLMEASIDAHEREHIASIKYYRRQLEYYERLDHAYRNRFHAVNGELNRLGLAVRLLETKTREDLEPLVLKSYEELIAPWPLPDPPASE